jgi:hypothetical protein
VRNTDPFVDATLVGASCDAISNLGRQGSEDERAKQHDLDAAGSGRASCSSRRRRSS